MHYYQQSAEQALNELGSNENGLTQSEADSRLERYGFNEIEVHGDSFWKKLTEPFRSIFMLILGIAVVISLATGETLDAAIIGVIIAVTATIYYVQRFSAERVLRSLSKHDIEQIEVYRDGQPLQLEPKYMVPGDIIRLYEGQKVPADARVVHADNVRCDEAMLTGESNPIGKHPESINEDRAVYAQTNMLFQGAFLVSGEATAVITATANDTEFGKIAVLSQGGHDTSPVQDKIDKLIMQIVAVVGSLAVLVLLLSVYREIALTEAIHFILVLSVSVIPEGLPVAISVVLVFGMRRMAHRKALVRNMAAIENIGLITTVASDKTGTLTKNQLSVQDVWQIQAIEPDETALAVRLSANQKDGRSHDPLDTAFTEYASRYKTDLNDYELVRSLPFDQELALSGNVWKTGKSHCIYLKGAPEKIVAQSTLDESQKEQADSQLYKLTTKGFRVIALARVLDEQVTDLEELSQKTVEFLGFFAIADGLRPEAKASILATQGAGVTVRMITGDHFETAFSIGKQLGLCESKDQVFDSTKMSDMDDEELHDAVARARVFSRVTPENKHRILSVLKQQDITAMTGDGVNDVPALTNAHVGIAMGSGSQIAKDAGDIVLLDDNFSSITSALEEGRKIFDNIRRMLFLLLTTSTGEALTMIMALVVGLPLPVLAVQILWINLATDSALVVPLGLEPAEKDVMKRKPRAPDQPILKKVVITRMVFIGSIMALVTLSLFAYFLQFTSLEYARTIAFSALVVMQWADAFNARSLWQSIFIRIRTMNPAFYIGLLAAIGLHFLALFGPVRELLSLELISLNHFFITTLIAVVPIIAAGELHKFLFKSTVAQ